MPRSKPAKKRVLSADPIYQSQLVSRFINRVMKDGKKSPAATQVYQAFDQIKEKTQKDPLVVFQEALENIKPIMEVRPRRIGGAAYQVPQPVRGDRKEALAIRWLINAARSRPNSQFHHFSEKLAAEILDALEKQGEAMKKRDTVQKMAEANKAFAHFRW